MQRHQRKAVVVQLGVVNIGYQRHVLQKMRQRLFFPFVLQKILRHADQLLQVFRPALRLRRPLCLQFFQIPGLVHYIFNKLFYGYGINFSHQVKQDLTHFIQFGDKPRAQSRHRRCIGNDLKQGNPLRVSIILHFIDRRLPDTPLGNIDDPQQTQRIIGIVQQLQVGHHIPDLFPVIKLDAAHHAVADAAFDQHLFKHAGLGVGAVQHRHIAIGKFSAANQLLRLLHYKAGFIPLIHRIVIGNCRTCGIFRPQLLRLAARIIFNHRIGSVQNHGSGTVILFQLQQRRLRIILFKIQYVTDIRAAPAVNALVRITHNAQVPCIPRQIAGQQILGPVGILILINHNIAEALLIFFPHLRKLRQNFYRQHQQVVEIHGVIGQQPFFIQFVHFRSFLLKKIACQPGERRRVLLLVLRVGNRILQRSGRKAFLIQVHFF